MLPIRCCALALALSSLPACSIDGPPGLTIGGLPTRPREGSYRIAQIAVGASVPQPDFAGFIITASPGGYRITWGGVKSFAGAAWMPSGTPQFVVGCSDGSCSHGDGDVVALGKEPGSVFFSSDPPAGKRGGFELTFSGDLVLDVLADAGLKVQKDPADPTNVGFVSGVNGQFVSAPSMPFGLTR